MRRSALHWAPRSPLIGLDQKTWAMLMAALVVLIIFALSARRERVKDQTDLQSMARAVTVMLPHASSSTRLQLLSAIAAEAAKHERAARAVASPVAGVAASGAASQAQRAGHRERRETARQPGLFQRGWQRLIGGKREAEAADEG